MKRVYIENGVVREIIPDEIEELSDFYPSWFVENVVEAPDSVHQHMIYENGDFFEPAPNEPEPSVESDIEAMLIDHEYRITMIELFGNEEV